MPLPLYLALVAGREEVLVARFYDENMAPIEVYCAAFPARFYTIAYMDLRLRTRSGVPHLAYQVAKALAEGMLTVEG